MWLHLDRQVEVTRLKLRGEGQVAVSQRALGLQQVLFDGASGCLPEQRVVEGLGFDRLWNKHVVELRLVVKARFLPEAHVQL